MGSHSRCADAYEQEGHIMIRVLVINALLFLLPFALTYRTTTGDAPGGTYISPSYKDGQIVPGRFE